MSDPMPRRDVALPPPAGYVRSDDHAALAAELDALRIERDALRAERDAAIAALSEEGRRRGAAEAEVARLGGYIEGWRQDLTDERRRAESAEAEVARLRGEAKETAGVVDALYRRLQRAVLAQKGEA